MGLVVFGVMALYLIVSIVVVKAAIRAAKKRGKTPWHWGAGAALVMYLIPFWDWVPTVVAHKYYCSTEAGFWVYKSVDQWKAENPGVMETLVANKGHSSSHEGDMDNFTSTEIINQRVKYVFKHNGPLFIHRWRLESQLVDVSNNEVLAQYIDFSTSHQRRQAGWSGWKLWLDTRSCSSMRHKDRGSIQEMIEGMEK